MNTQIQDIQQITSTRNMKKTTQNCVIIKIFNRAKMKGKP